jgi:hypothetical protein
MDQCSYILLSLKGIEKTQCDGYRRKNESAAWGRSIQKFIEQELTEFYTNFDSTFTIVSKFYCTIWIASNWYRTYRTQRRRAPKYRIKDCRFDSFRIKDSAKIATFYDIRFHNLQLPLATKKKPKDLAKNLNRKYPNWEFKTIIRMFPVPKPQNHSKTKRLLFYNLLFKPFN